MLKFGFMSSIKTTWLGISSTREELVCMRCCSKTLEEEDVIIIVLKSHARRLGLKNDCHRKGGRQNIIEIWG